MYRIRNLHSGRIYTILKKKVWGGVKRIETVLKLVIHGNYKKKEKEMQTKEVELCSQEEDV